MIVCLFVCEFVSCFVAAIERKLMQQMFALRNRVRVFR